jgi:hypothetical protein
LLLLAWLLGMSLQLLLLLLSVALHVLLLPS